MPGTVRKAVATSPKAKTPSQALAQKTTPLVVAHCGTQTCPQYGKDLTVPAGIVVAPGVLMNGTLSCMNCGAHLVVTAAADPEN